MPTAPGKAEVVGRRKYPEENAAEQATGGGLEVWGDYGALLFLRVHGYPLPGMPPLQPLYRLRAG